MPAVPYGRAGGLLPTALRLLFSFQRKDKKNSLGFVNKLPSIRFFAEAVIINYA